MHYPNTQKNNQAFQKNQLSGATKKQHKNRTFTIRGPHWWINDTPEVITKIQEALANKQSRSQGVLKLVDHTHWQSLWQNLVQGILPAKPNRLRNAESGRNVKLKDAHKVFYKMPQRKTKQTK